MSDAGYRDGSGGAAGTEWAEARAGAHDGSSAPKCQLTREWAAFVGGHRVCSDSPQARLRGPGAPL